MREEQRPTPPEEESPVNLNEVDSNNNHIVNTSLTATGPQLVEARKVEEIAIVIAEPLESPRDEMQEQRQSREKEEEEHKKDMANSKRRRLYLILGLLLVLGAVAVIVAVAVRNANRASTVSVEAFGNMYYAHNTTNISIPRSGVTGIIPTELGRLTQLTSIIMYINELSGTIPTQLGALALLEELWLSQNLLTGFIPTQLGQLTALTALRLSNSIKKDPPQNKTIPSELGLLNHLEVLWLDDLLLMGSIPTQLGLLTAMTDLWFDRNMLSGAVPNSTCTFPALRRVYTDCPPEDAFPVECPCPECKCR